MVLLLVYSAMISRLRPGCLRWQHSENADGRGQLEARQKMCLRARKREEEEQKGAREDE